MKTWIALIALFIASDAVAECTKSTLVGPPPTPRLWICQTEAEIPTSGLLAGDIVIALDTRALKLATSATETGGPTGGSASAAWDDVTGKPSTFPPTIGATGTTAVAGNDARLTDARTPTAHNHAATDINSGTLPDARLSANVSQLGSSIALTSEVTGTLPVANGGTGLTAVGGALQVLRTNAAANALEWSTPSGGSNYRTLVTLGADVTDNSGANTYTDCTGLSFVVTSGTRYRFYALIRYTAAATTTGSGWSINGPATTELAYSARFTLTATSNTFWTSTAYGNQTTSNATSLTAGNIAVLEGVILPSANGTVVVRFMSEVNGSAIVCKAGSTLEWW